MRSNGCTVIYGPVEVPHTDTSVCCRIMTESPLWYEANERYDEAEASLLQIAKWNKVPISGIRLKRGQKAVEKEATTKEEESGLVQNGGQPDRVTEHARSAIDVKVTDLFIDPLLRKHTIISSFLW